MNAEQKQQYTDMITNDLTSIMPGMLFRVLACKQYRNLAIEHGLPDDIITELCIRWVDEQNALENELRRRTEAQA